MSLHPRRCWTTCRMQTSTACRSSSCLRTTSTCRVATVVAGCQLTLCGIPPTHPSEVPSLKTSTRASSSGSASRPSGDERNAGVEGKRRTTSPSRYSHQAICKATPSTPPAARRCSLQPWMPLPSAQAHEAAHLLDLVAAVASAAHGLHRRRTSNPARAAKPSRRQRRRQRHA